MIQAGNLAYFDGVTKKFKPLRRAHNFKPLPDVKEEAAARCALLWGDEVYVVSIAGGDAVVSAKGFHLKVALTELRETPILSIYQIDCGQGDAALIQFPDGRWMAVDCGPPRTWSNSGNVASDFLVWKMFVDQSWKNEFNFRKQPFRLDDVVCTHPDTDHFGGFIELTEKHVKKKTLQFGTVWHGGMGRYSGTATDYANGSGHGQLGPVQGNAIPDAFLTALIDSFADVRTLSKSAPNRAWKLNGDYGDWLSTLANLEGNGVEKLQRPTFNAHLPGYEPQQDMASIKVLGPVFEQLGGKPALRYLDNANAASMKSPSLTRNGHSVVLRLDYGKARILLTGDLNFKSHALLLGNLPKSEFACDVAKACHHGSEDVSSTFLEAMSPLATMFSSGDNEAYAHPRARVLGMAGLFGKRHIKGKNKFLGLTEDKVIAPLIYSTELSRSVQLFPAFAVYCKGKRVLKPELQALHRSGKGGGARKLMGKWMLADGLVYGLINVRTDGKKVIMAVMKESDSSYQVEELQLS